MNALAAIIDEVKQDAAGLSVLSEWLGRGGIPVSQELAESRATVCKSCPQNIFGWMVGIKGVIAETIRHHIEVQNKVGLHVSNEERLGLCKTCGCVLRLKVFVPVEHVANHTTMDQLKAFPEFCWQSKEILKLLPNAKP